MKKILFLMMGLSCSVFALEQNPIAPPKANIVDRFGVNLQTGQLARTLDTVSIGGELGLKHSVQLYTDLFTDGGYYGFVDGFAGTVIPRNISLNSVQVMTSADGNDPLYLRDLGGYESDHTKRISVMRPYGPAGSQDFLVYQSGVLNRDATATTGLTFKAVGDSRHTLVESADKNYLIWTTPEGIESKYASSNRRLIEVTYPNGYKVRVAYRAVTTNTGFMLKYQLNNQGLSGTPDEILAINRANQYCSENASIACSSTGWPTAKFTWPLGTPSIFWTPGYQSSGYLIKMTTDTGVTDIQYLPEDVCIKEFGGVDTNCATTRSGPQRWIPRLRSIRTSDSNVPNYQYTYKNRGEMIGEGVNGTGVTYWSLFSTSGQITGATLNGTDSQGYSTSTNSYNAKVTWANSEIWVDSSMYDLNVIESVVSTKGGTYSYIKDSRHLIEFHTPVMGGGPKKHFYYGGPKGNLSKITAVTSVGETLLQEATYGGYDSTGKCIFPKTCNKPTIVKDARGNVTTYEYDSQGRFGSPVKIIFPPDKNNNRPVTVYNYVPLYASYKKDGETITQDSDPVWMLSSEYTCHSGDASSCSSTSPDVLRSDYYYGPQNTGLANNLLLRGKSVTAASNGIMTTRVTCYEYNKYGNMIGETSPKGSSTNLQSCQ